ncbi:WbqC family protein [Urechidicola croceus]|uniref:WbqC-like protein n=1 Tax=Urechidicola croceus TaxID=1850246 RepID=A0A1D8P6M8_9FLAO|nr:WbqC family protein [Urechidicola croceus]AOW20219.1 hypothetical protein LPB138_05805 [Urechidicola croceus]
MNCEKIVFEVQDNFQKQTYRNRSYIYSANGKLLLNIPVLHNKNGIRQSTKDVRIENSFQWQKLHFKSLQSAYRSSPFFEFYEDDLSPLYEQKQNFLLDFNLKCHEFIMDAIQEEITTEQTTQYDINPSINDCRFLANAKQHTRKFDFKPYVQVFDDKHGFISNLSILDLLFMKGPNTFDYLKSQNT